MGDLKQLIQQAERTFLQNFPAQTCFERAVFFSWACRLKECCKYCYMSTLPAEKRTAEKVRSFASLLAETILTKELGWDYGFLSGGIGVFDDDKILELLELTTKIMKEKVWINIGILNEQQLKKFKPYIKGVVGTIEVLDPKLHKEICPSKPIKPVVEMFKKSSMLGLKNAMTLITGLGETISDFKLLEKFIKENNIQKIHIYGLNPQKGTIFENNPGPSAEYQAEWIARTRIAFPQIDIQAGIWTNRTDRVALLLKAGANSISKFPALKLFGTKPCQEIEQQAKMAGRKFRGTLTKLPNINWNKKVERLNLNEELELQTKKKLAEYLKGMQKEKNINAAKLFDEL